MTRPIPPSLVKHGIAGVQDNLQPGQEVNFIKPLFWVFREEFEARLLKPVPRSALPSTGMEPDQG